MDTGKALEAEVLRLFELVNKMRRELATIYHPAESGQIFERVADQFDAIASETEASTQTILEANEKIAAISKKMGAEIKYGGARSHFEAIDAESHRIFEACQAHDIVSQRLGRIVRTINLLEGSINSLVVTLGTNEVTGVSSALSNINKKDGDLELSGPAIGDEGMDQSDIDDLFENEKSE